MPPKGKKTAAASTKAKKAPAAAKAAAAGKKVAAPATPKKKNGGAAYTPVASPMKMKLGSAVDPEVPMDPRTGVVYHLACTGADIADHIILVGDPGRVPKVAERFDKGSITFRGVHREIAIITGKYQGVPVSCLSTGMGTDNCEIVLNEIHAVKEYDRATNTWAAAPAPIRIIRVGTCGCPQGDIPLGTLAVTRHGIGMDNTCKYYQMPKGKFPASVADLEARANATPLGKVGVYGVMASPEVTAAIVAAHAADKAVVKRRAVAVGTTASGSGFYGCQGRAVGRLRGTLTVPHLVDDLGAIRLPVADKAGRALVGADTERVVNIEMENSAICFLSRALGYQAGTVCAIIATRAGAVRSFATPEESASAIADAITVALNAIISLQ